MQNIFEKIIIGVLCIIVLSVVVLDIFQQKELNRLASEISKNEKIPVVENKTIDVESQEYLKGEIKSLSDNNLSVETVLIYPKDREKEKADKEKMKAGIAITVGPNDFESIKKTIEVTLNDKTKYYGLNRENLKIGDNIFVSTSGFPYKQNKVIAKTVSIAGPEPAQ